MMTKRFESELRKAQTFQRLEKDPLRAAYWYGYQRGLRRAHHGDVFGTEAEHTVWMDLIHSVDMNHVQQGIGYRDGLKAGGER